MLLGTVIHKVLSPSGVKTHKISASARAVLKKDDIFC
jgi:hypothetical protein